MATLEFLIETEDGQIKILDGEQVKKEEAMKEENPVLFTEEQARRVYEEQEQAEKRDLAEEWSTWKEWYAWKEEEREYEPPEREEEGWEPIIPTEKEIFKFIEKEEEEEKEEGKPWWEIFGEVSKGVGKLAESGAKAYSDVLKIDILGRQLDYQKEIKERQLQLEEERRKNLAKFGYNLGDQNKTLQMLLALKKQPVASANPYLVGALAVVGLGIFIIAMKK